MQIINILATVFVLVLTSFGLGTLINKLASTSWKILLGISVLLTITQIITPICMYMNVQTIVIFSLYWLTLGIGSVIGLKQLCRHKYTKNNMIKALILTFVVIIYSYLFTTKTLGLETFDSLFYLNFAKTNAFSSHLGQVNYSTGVPLENYYIGYDFTSFYYLFSSFMRGLGELTNSTSMLHYIYVWGSSIFFWILSCLLVFETIKELEVKNKWIKCLCFVIVLGFFGTLYFNQTFPMIGNTYRRLFAGAILLQAYKICKHDLGIKGFVVLGFLSCAQIASSSSGFFISLIALYCIIMYEISQNKEDIGRKIIACTWPVLYFSIIYLKTMNSQLLVLVIVISVLFYSFLLVFDFKLTKRHKNTILKIMKISIYIAPIVIALISIFLLNDHYSLFANFYEKHARYDMVYELKNFDSLSDRISTIFLLVAVASLFIQNKVKEPKWILFIFIITFYNPINYVFVYKLFAGEVWYRITDLIFNPFIIILATSSLAGLFKKEVCIKFFSGLFIIVFCYISYNQGIGFYHDYFIPKENFNPLLKLNTDRIEVIDYINESKFVVGRDSRIISQISEAKSFVFGMQDYLKITDNNDLRRMFHLYDFSDEIPGELFRTKNTCKMIEDEKVDAFILRKDQAYKVNDKGDYYPVALHVRDCGGEFVYENETYILYYFYWTK